MPYITYDEGDGEKKSVRLRQDARLHIGRGENNDIRLSSNPKVSRNHCSIYFHPAETAYALIDLGSTNGTIRNGQKIASDIFLSDGDEITVGGIKFKFHDSDMPSLQPRGIKTAEPVKSFGLEDIPSLERTQSLLLSETDTARPPQSQQFAVYHELAIREGDVIEGNRIGRKISDSVMASSFLVETPEGSEVKEALLKVFKKSIEDEMATEDFLNCVQEAAKVQHPGFVKYLEAGVHEGHCYFITEYLDNLTLAKRISLKAPLPERDCLEIVREIAADLSFALSAFKLFHRNLKPANVLYRKDDSIAITDYGLATWESVNLAGSVSVASPWYISPEQVRGRKITWSCDLYSLGVILFQMLTGVLPFHSTVEEELLGMHIAAPFPEPAERNPNVKVSKPTMEIIKMMTAKEPSGRYDAWADCIQAIDASIESLRAKPDSQPFHPENSSPPGTAPISPAVTASVKRGKITFKKNKPRM
jgi:pSer/pThr/pTyr-binding forkhead associated (FHA) protein